MKADHWTAEDQVALEKEIEAHHLVCGIDEVGRGPIAGPVLACAIIMPSGSYIPGVKDSKKLSEKKRESLYDTILSQCLAWGIGMRDAEVIDQINIRQATLLAMKDALESLHDREGKAVEPDLVLVDAEHVETDLLQESIIKGDDRVYAISCASIIAKVTRDRMMIDYGRRFPEYGFCRHKGYGTKAHYEAIEKYGLLPVHRMSFIHREGLFKHARYQEGIQRFDLSEGGEPGPSGDLAE